MVSSVGLRSVEVESNGKKVPLFVLYPTHASEQMESLGPFTLSVARDAPPTPSKEGLVLISHGTARSPIPWRT